MANELRYRHSTGGLTTLYAVLFPALDPDAIINASTGASLALSAANWPTAAITLTAVSGMNMYLGSIPAGAATGDYHVSVYLMNSGSADEDADTLLGTTITPIGWYTTTDVLVPPQVNVTFVDGIDADADQDIINLVQARR